MRPRYLPMSLTSSSNLTATVGRNAQLCHTPFALSVLSGPVSTRSSMVQSSALLTATSSSLPKSVLLTISLSATMASAGRSRKGACSPLPGVASGMLKCFSRAMMRPKPSGRQVISPSSSFAATFAIHMAPLVPARRVTSFRRRPPKSSAATLRSSDGENEEPVSSLLPSSGRQRSTSR